MSTHHEQSLPQEIFDSVIDHFHADTHTLQTCALVAPSWLSSSRAHLFHRVVLNPPKPIKNTRPFRFGKKMHGSSCRRLFECVESSVDSRLGNLAVYIRELHLCEGMLASEWLAIEATLPRLLRALLNLRRFEISRDASVQIQWSQLSSSWKGALEGHVFRLPSFTEFKMSSLTFNNLEDLGKVLRSCKHLRVLEVDHIMFTDESPFGLGACAKDEVPRAEKASLDMLVVGPRTSAAFITYLSHPSSGVTVSTVRKLSMSISRNFEDFAKLLHASLSVEHLELGLMNDVDLKEYWNLAPEKHFDLSQVPHLRNLRVNIDVLQKLDDPLPWLSTVLRTGIDSERPTRINQVQTIWIIYSLYLPAPYMDRSVNTTIFDGWKEIDDILSGTAKLGPGDDDAIQGSSHGYQNLEIVKLDFALENPIGFGVAPRFLKEVVLDSPGLGKKDVLRISASDTSK
ncbi:hypothetical protein CPB84DRAFT_1960076 [Gymnopilus junonius]|uniref:F-box protein n=1 Tax=Gymnopilus junonius TaxID=109634 RepID=A0A9P5TRA0_GYMJU|nr:hypothetical protein CPB84DRAFT_1960076 [Gymnopilus junonius]